MSIWKNFQTKIASFSFSRVSENRKSNSSKAPYCIPVLLGLILCLAVVFMFPQGRSFQFAELQVGDVYIGDEVIAPFDFPINKSKLQLELDIQEAKQQVSSVFIRDNGIIDAQITWLESFFLNINAIRDSVMLESKKIEILTTLLTNYNIIISDENIAGFLDDKSRLEQRNRAVKAKSDLKLANFEKELIELTRELYSIGILNLDKKEIKNGNGKISVISDGEEAIEDTTFFLSIDGAKRYLKSKVDQRVKNKKEFEVLAKVGYQIITSSLLPNLIYNKTETDLRIQQAVHSVPLAKGMVLEDERVIDTHERVTPAHLQKLKSLAEARVEIAEDEGGIKVLLPFTGKILYAGLLLALFGIFLFQRKRDILKNSTLIFIIFLINLLVIFFSFTLNNFGVSEYLLPVTIASMLLTIFFDLEFGLVGTVILSLMLGALRGNDFNVVVVSIFAGAIASISVNKVRTRNWLPRSLFMIVSAYVLSILALEFLRYASFHKVFLSVGYGVVNGVVSPILAYGFVVIIESSFDLITDMKLLELSDLNKPLLRELAMKAPGTYFHSAVVGNLSEGAAEAIGANSLLARVGAYYHDIGKIINPRYFIENQNRGSINPHEKLAPSMSSLILVNHVRKGIELAKRYKLPGEIVDFIKQHHGTNLMSPFYQKALNLNNGKDTKVNESNFRYPGPRPKTKETGIVMLADAVEAASRTLRDPTTSRIQAMVDSIIRDRFSQSELDESPLTLSELHIIGKNFQKFLVSIFHARIEYPDQEDKFFRKTKSADKL